MYFGALSSVVLIFALTEFLHHTLTKVDLHAEYLGMDQLQGPPKLWQPSFNGAL